jgi:hypothetical protein
MAYRQIRSAVACTAIAFILPACGGDDTQAVGSGGTLGEAGDSATANNAAGTSQGAGGSATGGASNAGGSTTGGNAIGGNATGGNVGAGGADASAAGGAGGSSMGKSDATSDARGATPTYPLRASANKRYLVGQNGAPFLMAGDAPQCLTVKLSPADMAVFFSMRASQSFNAMWVNALCESYTGGNAAATTYDGIAPFTGKFGSGDYDLSKPNPAFFARVDAAVKAAADVGIVLLLDPAETGGFLKMLKANGVAASRAYGRFIGQRYVNDDNIIWLHGNDFQSWRTAADDAVVQAVALGIKDVDTRHLHTIELDYNVSSSLDDAANWSSAMYPILGLNATYTYFPTYAQLYKDYNRANFLPSFMIEANYEGENNLGGPHTTNAHDCRTEYYWSNLSGATGSLYGNHWIWPLDPAWKSHLNDPGALEVAYLQNLFLPRAWYDLVPDQKNMVVVSGFGTYADTGNAQDNTYATTARTADGSLVMTYMPTARAVTVDMTKLAGSAVGRWYDPAAGVYSAITGSPFANTGMHVFTPPAAKHADGFDDWVLVLETNPPP